MPLISKPNYNQIFASQAPEQDKPAVFNNYPEGWGVESRPNNGKPTIKGFNFLQQTSDLKALWILQNGACLPYDESIEYAEGAVVLKDGVIQYKVGSGFTSVTPRNFYETLAAANADIANIQLGQAVNIGEAENGGLWYKATAGATSLTKSPHDPLTQAKADATTKANAAESNAKDYFKENADVRFEANAQSNINYTTADRNLTFSGTVYVITSAGTKVLTTPQVLNLPSNTRYRIEYNISTNTLRAVAYNASRSDSWAVAGIVTVSANGITTSDFAYFVNGAAVAADSQSEYGELTTDVGTRINFSTTDKTLTITNSRVLSAGFTYVQSASVAIPYPASSGLYSLVFNRSTRTFSFKARTSVTANNDIVLAKINFDSSFVPTITGLERYAIDGAVPSSVAAGIPVGFLIATDKSEINFDFKTGSIIIAASRVRALTTVAAAELLPATIIDISAAMQSVQKLLYNTKTKTFRFLPLVNSILTDEVIVATFYGAKKYVSGVPYYLIDGEDPAAVKDDLSSANFLIPYGNLEAEYEQPTLPAFANLQTNTTGDYLKVYALYDALMSSHPDYITKTLLGVDGLGNQIYQYQFNAQEVNTVASAQKRPKIIAISGVHGYEPTGIYNLFYALKQIADNWQSDSKLEALRWGVNFIVVPVSNPSGFDLVSRYNHNDVDIARNFPAQWSAGQPNSGGSPLSQAETVILDAVMSNNRDAIYCFSHHNFHTPSGSFIWNASGTDFGVNLAKMLIIGQTIRAKKRYPDIMPQANNYYIGYANKGTPPGSEGLQAQSYGIQGGTFEICNRWEWEVDTPVNSSIVATMGVEALINWLLLNVKYGCELYNTKVNL